ncbi:MAG: hypothetical protein J7J09_00350 [Kosmotoga sp.]|nr:hypothetical protein [Kosmotoga sp.]
MKGPEKHGYKRNEFNTSGAVQNIIAVAMNLSIGLMNVLEIFAIFG